MKMKINSKDFRVRPGEKVKLREWPTIVKPFCKSKKRYQKLLGEHVEEQADLFCRSAAFRARQHLPVRFTIASVRHRV
jgi:hypothetical protein